MRMKPDRRALGAAGEDAACRFLQGEGFVLVERNWRTRAGEIDVIAAKGGLIVFAEVKSRTGTAFGEPEESVTPVKARRIRGLASEYLSQSERGGDVRFDVIAVMLDGDGNVKEIRHTPDAF
jgi:putative endonuclease